MIGIRWLRNHFPRLLNNPILMRELLVRLRSGASFFHLGILLTAGMICILFFWSQYFTDRIIPGRNWELNVREMFRGMNFIVGAAIACLIPLFSATIINTEMERETWDLLFTTPINLATILAGKFLSSVFFFWMLLFSMTPIYFLFLLLGGISTGEILFVLAMMTEVICVIGLIGLFCSAYWKRTVQAVSFTYVIGFLYLLGISFLRPFWGLLWSAPRGTFGPEFVLSPLVIAAVFFANERLPNEVGSWAVAHPYQAHGWAVALSVVIILFMATWALRRCMRGDHAAAGISKKRWTWLNQFIQWVFSVEKQGVFPEGINPVARKEVLEFTRNRWFKWINVGSFFLMLFFMYSLLFIYHNLHDWYQAFLFMPLIVPIFIFPYAANAIRNELDRDSYNMLLATTLTPEKIYTGKFMGGIELIKYRILYLLGPPLVFVIIFGGWLEWRRDWSVWELSGGSLVMSLMSSYFFLTLGMYYSSRVKKSTMAYGLIFFSGMFLYILVIVIFEMILELPVVIHLNTRATLYPLLAVLSPPFLYINYGSLHYSNRWYGIYWWKLVALQVTWMFFLSLWLRGAAIHWMKNKSEQS